MAAARSHTAGDGETRRDGGLEGVQARDCTGLADLLRMGRLVSAWIAPPQVRELRELTRYRIKLVRLRSSAEDQVHAVLARLGIPVPCPDLFGGYGSAWLDGPPRRLAALSAGAAPARHRPGAGRGRHRGDRRH